MNNNKVKMCKKKRKYLFNKDCLNMLWMRATRSMFRMMNSSHHVICVLNNNIFGLFWFSIGMHCILLYFKKKANKKKHVFSVFLTALLRFY